MQNVWLESGLPIPAPLPRSFAWPHLQGHSICSHVQVLGGRTFGDVEVVELSGLFEGIETSTRTIANVLGREKIYVSDECGRRKSKPGKSSKEWTKGKFFVVQRRCETVLSNHWRRFLLGLPGILAASTAARVVTVVSSSEAMFCVSIVFPCLANHFTFAFAIFARLFLVFTLLRGIAKCKTTLIAPSIPIGELWAGSKWQKGLGSSDLWLLNSTTDNQFMVMAMAHGCSYSSTGSALHPVSEVWRKHVSVAAAGTTAPATNGAEVFVPWSWWGCFKLSGLQLGSAKLQSAQLKAVHQFSWRFLRHLQRWIWPDSDSESVS